jgi:hypothetical protein
MYEMNLHYLFWTCERIPHVVDALSNRPSLKQLKHDASQLELTTSAAAAAAAAMNDESFDSYRWDEEDGSLHIGVTEQEFDEHSEQLAQEEEDEQQQSEAQMRAFQRQQSLKQRNHRRRNSSSQKPQHKRQLTREVRVSASHHLVRNPIAVARLIIAEPSDMPQQLQQRREKHRTRLNQKTHRRRSSVESASAIVSSEVP